MPEVIFELPGGSETKVAVEVGTTVMEAAHQGGVDLIEGACEGAMACSTCHVIVAENWFKKLRQASEDEEDMLDLTLGLKPTSRLGCQISVTDDLDGLRVAVPAQHNNMMGF